MENNIWTVYVHVNKSNGKMYVGITSQKVENRWLNGAGYLQCPKFHNAINKYGWDGFDHEIIAERLTESEAKNFEKTLISKLNTQSDKYGYNMSAGGDGIYGYKHTDETKEKLRQIYYNMPQEIRQKMLNALRGRKLSDEHKSHISKSCMNTGTKKICQYELNGCFIRLWDSLTDASNFTGVHIGDISSCCNGRKGQTGSYQWKFYDGNTDNISPYIVDMSRHKVVQKDLDNNIIKIWNSLKEIRQTLGISTNNITSVCNGYRNKANGYKWEYLN